MQRKKGLGWLTTLLIVIMLLGTVSTVPDYAVNGESGHRGALSDPERRSGAALYQGRAVSLLSLQQSGLITISQNNFEANTSYGLYSTTSLIAEGNWWGDTGGPYHPTLNPQGHGDSVSDNVDFDPWLVSAVDIGLSVPPYPTPDPGVLIIYQNNFENNSAYGLYNDSASINAENNWWGNASGPYHPALNPGGLGDRVSDNVDFEPWLTSPAQPPGYTYSISGRVTDSSANPIYGVTISDNAGHSVTTTAGGYYTITGLITGTYTVVPSKSGYVFSPASRIVTVPPSATSQNFVGTLVAGTFTGTIVPIFPSAHTTSSTVMQGGIAYRYFRLLDANGNFIPGVTVAFSFGSPATTDDQGYFTATIPASSLGNPGSYAVSVQSVTIGGQTYTTNNQPTFTVEVDERRYAHSWSYGAIRQASAGVSTGLIAYLSAETNGGLSLTLEESNPDRTDDDRVGMEEHYSLETGAEVGVGIRRNISACIVKSELDASVTTEARLRHFGDLEAQFNQPYADNDRKAQGIFLALSILDSATGIPAQPLIVSMLQVAEARLPYLDYISTQSVGTAVKVTPLRAHIGAEVGLTAKRGGSQSKGKTLGFTLLDVGASRLVAMVLTDYGNEYSVGFEDEFSMDLAMLSPDLPWIKNKLIGILDNQARRLHKEYFFDSATHQLKRIELTLISEGNPNIFTDVTKKQVAIRITLEGENLTPSLIEQVGQTQVISDLNALLRAVPEMPYSVEVEDGSSFLNFAQNNGHFLRGQKGRQARP